MNNPSWLSRSRAVIGVAILAIATAAMISGGAGASTSNPKIAYLSFAVGGVPCPIDISTDGAIDTLPPVSAISWNSSSER